MSLNAAARPNTVMGRALAQRALDLTAAFAARPSPVLTERIDLTWPAARVTPGHVRAAAEAALDRGETHYTSRPGVPELRQGIARRLTEDGFPATPETVVVTNGGTEALYIVLQSLLGSGEPLAIVEPVPRHVREMSRFIGAEVVPIATDPADRFVPDAAPVDAATVLLLASPSPVSGVAIPPPALARLIESALERDTTVVLDRSFATALYDPELAGWSRSDLGARVFTIGSFSSGHGLRGWRVGYFSTPADRVKRLRELKQAMSICTTSVSQFAALAALEGPQAWLADRRRAFAERRDRAVAALRLVGVEAIEPDAYPTLLIDVRSVDADDRRFAARLAEATGVIVEPGSEFGGAAAGFVRIDLEAEDEILAAGLTRLTGALREWGNA